MIGRSTLAAMAVMAAGAGLADEPYYYAPGGVALSGYDAVLYLEENHAVEGSPDNALKWRGAIWYFATPDTLMSFEMNPEAYAPQFGGYCAYGVARGKTAGSAPKAFFIQDGKLYFMHNETMVSSMQDHLSLIVSEAEAHWPEALGQ
jgi:hypothetical protein